MTSIEDYLRQYADDHKSLGIKVTHMIGIPMIVASLPIFPFNPLLGGGLFLGGWALQLVGHYVFERNKPAFLGDWKYLAVGPLWVAVELLELIGIDLPIAAAVRNR